MLGPGSLASPDFTEPAGEREGRTRNTWTDETAADALRNGIPAPVMLTGAKFLGQNLPGAYPMPSILIEGDFWNALPDDDGRVASPLTLGYPEILIYPTLLSGSLVYLRPPPSVYMPLLSPLLKFMTHGELHKREWEHDCLSEDKSFWTTSTTISTRLSGSPTDSALRSPP